MLNSTFKSLTFVFVSVLVFGFTDSVVAQKKRGSGQFGVAMILKKLDANGNGVLEPTEMGGRTKDFVRKAGLDPNRAHTIATITKMLEDKDKKSKQAGQSGATDGSEVARKVPGFGTETEKLGVPDFSPSGEERMSEDAMNRKFGDSVMRQVNQTLKRYDKDKNGLIDLAEQKRTRWSNPSADESDTNKDSNLSRLELAYRYKNREDEVLKKKQAVSKRMNASNRNKAAAQRNAAANANTRYNRTSRGTNRGSSRGTSKGSSGADKAAKSGFNNGSDAYKRYAEGLIKNYDKNKDQKLSKQEMEEMRRPPKNADSNKDGYVDKAELIASVTARSTGGTAASSNQVSATRSSGNKELDNKRRSPNKSFNQADSIFGGKDLNNDRQLQMAEFADSWNEETVQEFKAKDLNDDGVITEKEWQGNK